LSTDIAGQYVRSAIQVVSGSRELFKPNRRNGTSQKSISLKSLIF